MQVTHTSTPAEKITLFRGAEAHPMLLDERCFFAVDFDEDDWAEDAGAFG